jgi:hypothetical protein
MSTPKGIATGGRVLSRWIQEDAGKGTLVQRILNYINTLADNTASSAAGRIAPPPPINGLSVTTGGEYAHVAIQHSGAIQQGCHYFVEVANNQNFANAWPVHFGASRTRDPIHLAPYDASGNAQKWYLRGFAQYPGSNPSTPVAYGGASPTAITTTGTTHLSWTPSTGSGTSSNTGAQVGWGFGKTQRRSQ